MRKTQQIILALVLIPALVGLSEAITTFMGKMVQGTDTQQVNSVPVSTGNGAADAGTQRVAIATGTVPFPVQVLGSTIQVTGLGGGSVVADVTVVAPLPAGTNNIGTVSGSTVTALQGTTPWNVSGSTVVVNLSSTSASVTAFQGGTWNVGLNAGANQIGTVSGSTVVASISQAIPGVTNAVYVTNSSSQTIMKSSNVTKSSVAATTTSQELLPAEPTRMGVECASLCTNNKDVYLNINSASAATSGDYPLSPCSSWTPPAGTVPIGAIQVIAESLTQVIRCVSYLP